MSNLEILILLAVLCLYQTSIMCWMFICYKKTYHDNNIELCQKLIQILDIIQIKNTPNDFIIGTSTIRSNSLSCEGFRGATGLEEYFDLNRRLIKK